MLEKKAMLVLEKTVLKYTYAKMKMGVMATRQQSNQGLPAKLISEIKKITRCIMKELCWSVKVDKR